MQIALSLLACASLQANERISGFSSGETVTIHSAQAWEDEEPGIIHFSGGFELKANDWHLVAEQATLYGKLDDPDRVMLTGTPALIRVNTDMSGIAHFVTGQATQIFYYRDSNSIQLKGTASLSRSDTTMQGGEIAYDIERDHLKAGGQDGVHIKLLGEE